MDGRRPTTTARTTGEINFDRFMREPPTAEAEARRIRERIAAMKRREARRARS